jgi:sulfur relay (sulfurtransferase) DsrF/TusC family protein
MSEKNVLIIIKSTPFRRINYYEALRVAVGLWEHTVSVIWMGDGIYAALNSMDQTLTNRFLEEIDLNLFVEEEALHERGFKVSDVLHNAKVINREKISELILDAQTSLVF